MSRSAEWYFDFISPFAYLQFKHFHRLPADLEVRLVPVLFAGLLGHWEHKGPAEIPAKRVQTYRYCHWLAGRLGVPFRVPPAHPFNPLVALRLAIALEAREEAVATLFDFIWSEGGDIAAPGALDTLATRLDVGNAAELVAAPAVKQALRDNTAAAIARGVYGVPTFAVDEELFWGFDATDMLLDYLADPALMADPEMQRLARLPSAATRRA
ncbi:MAG: 2-hydroxychromene-2-carboxylate isomerase [Gammaproteobacteria bacterium]|nr:2-hydroxychromene-2-carboxylate isomerase [Gammaproteobacteria bacterium]MCP5200890.1 2-hydroxychromene-2-carboxylate isomerase [Gammaproteobacteria bacterium]